jgi:hypothetical protein
MNQSQLAINRELQISGTLLILGLVVAIISLLWKAPLAFLLFAGVGGLLTVAGILLYLYSIVAPSETSQTNEPSKQT